MKGDRRYAGNHCILYLECRTIGAAARHRCFLTIRLRFLQFRGWRTILKRTFGSLKEKPAGENRTALTQFQTFSTALAAAMGTGNIIGVAAALCIGGPGAVF